MTLVRGEIEDVMKTVVDALRLMMKMMLMNEVPAG